MKIIRVIFIHITKYFNAMKYGLHANDNRLYFIFKEH